MAAKTAQVALDTARTLLNDDPAVTWTNTVLLPKLNEAFRELQQKLTLSDASLMQTTSVTTVNAGTGGLVIGTIKEPIRLWEKFVSDPNDAYTVMTERYILPNRSSGVEERLRDWQWDGSQINFIAATTNRSVKVFYWQEFADLVDGTSSLQFIDAELYLAPRTAALMASIVGEDARPKEWNALAETNLKQIILANRGRVEPRESAKP